MSISTIIITKNEATHIATCIKSVLWTDEIIILDCGSTDQTQEICKTYAPKVKLYVTDWPGFGKQKNRALTLATSTWMLSIDADEQVTPELKQEILQTLKNTKYTAYKIPFVDYFLDKPIKYYFGLLTYSRIRLAKKEFCKFSDDIVHEKIMVTGKIGKLKNKLHHFSFANIETLINKINSYSTLGAIKLYSQNKTTCFSQAFGHACWTFIKIYFLKFGFINGWRGFIIALSNFEGTFYRYVKLLEKDKHVL